MRGTSDGEILLESGSGRGKSIVDKTLFHQSTGSLFYLAIWTRSDIAAAVFILSRFRHVPTAYFHLVVKQVLRYLRGTVSLGLEHKRDRRSLMAVVDSAYTGDTTSRKSNPGMAVLSESSLCAWNSREQKRVAFSMCEAECKRGPRR